VLQAVTKAAFAGDDKRKIIANFSRTLLDKIPFFVAKTKAA